MTEVFCSTPPPWLNGHRNARAAWIRFVEYGRRMPITTTTAIRAASLVRYARLLADFLDCHDSEQRKAITARAEYFDNMRRQSYTRQQRDNFKRLHKETLDRLRQLDRDLQQKRRLALDIQREFYPFPRDMDTELKTLLREVIPIGQAVLMGKGA